MEKTGKSMRDNKLQTFVDVVKRYYPEKEIGAENNHVWANGYLGALVRCLLQKGYEEKLSFLRCLIDHVRYREALDTTQRFINELVDIGIIYKDGEAKDLYWLTKNGFRVLEKISISGRVLWYCY